MKSFKRLWLWSLITILSGSGYGNGYMIDDEKVLYVGKELFEETLLLKNGARAYQLQGLKPLVWYEVKISYPASIPSSFSLQLRRGPLDFELNNGRKLLNTEKLIFKADEIGSSSEVGMHVIVHVEPEGVVALPGKHEREYVIFNIVCDELLLGIPHKAWYVVAAALLCLLLAFVIPSFLPPPLLPRNGNTSISKDT